MMKSAQDDTTRMQGRGKGGGAHAHQVGGRRRNRDPHRSQFLGDVVLVQSATFVAADREKLRGAGGLDQGVDAGDEGAATRKRQ